MCNLFATRLDLKVPEDFLAQLGCETVSNFVGFYFDAAYHYAVYDNGVTEDEIDRHLWECWKQQRQVVTIFGEIDRLWKDCGESYGLILEVDTSTFFMASTSAITDFLYQSYIKTNKLPDL